MSSAIILSSEKISNKNFYGLLMKRQWLLLNRNPSMLVNPLMFYLLMLMLFPLVLGADMKLLKSIAPSIIWLPILFSQLLAQTSLFKEDYQDGVIEHWLLSPYSLMLIVLVRVLCHWLFICLPLILFTPLMTFMFGLEWHVLVALSLSLLLGSLTINFIGAIGQGLTLGVEHNDLILALLNFPLWIPVIIFATSATSKAALGLPFSAEIAIMLALFIMSLLLAPAVIAGALRNGVN